MTGIRTSDQDRVRQLRNPVGVFMKRAVVRETHKLSRTYPEPLVPVRGIRVSGFSIDLDVVLSGEPEPSVRREILDELGDLIENFIARRNDGVGANDECSHESSPLRSGPGGSDAGDDPAEIVAETADAASTGVGQAGTASNPVPAQTYPVCLELVGPSLFRVVENPPKQLLIDLHEAGFQHVPVIFYQLNEVGCSWGTSPGYMPVILATRSSAKRDPVES